MRSSAILATVGAAGFLAAGGLGAAAVFAQTEPTKEVTIDLKEGPPGPAGPKGEKGDPGERGPAGGTTCPTGFVFGKLTINHPGGQTVIYTCMTPGSNQAMKPIAQRIWNEPAVCIGLLVSIVLLVLALLNDEPWDLQTIIGITAPLASALGIRQFVTPTSKGSDGPTG